MTQAGRASVAGVLEAVLAACTVGRSRVVLIEGAAGCGKTHLLDAVAEHAAAEGALVLTAAATEAERRTPLGVLRQLVDDAPDFALPHSRAGKAPHAFQAEVCELALAGPVVLCVDDVHHADPQSSQHLGRLVRHARPAPVLVVATVASYAAEARCPWSEAEWTRQPHYRRIQLGLLSRTTM